MQRKQTQRELSPAQNIMATILQSIPKEADVTKIDYEGPRIAIYTKNPKYLMEHNEVISNMVNVIKKRIVVRIWAGDSSRCVCFLCIKSLKRNYGLLLFLCQESVSLLVDYCYIDSVTSSNVSGDCSLYCS